MFNELFIGIASLFGGVSVTGVLGFVIYFCLKSAFNKQLKKLDVEAIVDKKVDKAVKEKVETVAFTHSIQPVVESELEKLNEKADKHIENTVSRLEKKIEKVILIQEKQAKYFDNSIGVSDEAKKELKEAIESAKVEEVKPIESVVVSKAENKVVELAKTNKIKVSR